MAAAAEHSPLHVAQARRRQAHRESSMSVNLTPAIDITFNLLIFFLVATTFKTEEGILQSHVPAQQGMINLTPLPVSPIRVRVSQFGDGLSDYRVAIDNWPIVPRSFLELTTELEAIQLKPGFDAQTPVIIFAGDTVQWDHVVNCFNAIRRAFHKGDGRSIDPAGQPFENISFAAGSG